MDKTALELITKILDYMEPDEERHYEECEIEDRASHIYNDIAAMRSLLEAEHGYFTITRVHRDDLRELGYDTSRVDDATMTRLAGKLADAYCENVFWIDLAIVANHLGIPRKSDNCTDIQ